MINLNFTEEEIEVIKISLQNCLKTCKSSGTGIQCPDCETIEKVINKLEFS